MSRTQVGPRFIFHGNAMPFGARIEAVNGEPHLELVKGPPAAALPVAGGWSLATSTGSNHRDLFKWGATVADCKGERLGDLHYRTTVISSIADVFAKNDPHVFAADHIEIKVVSDHYEPGEQPRIVPKQISFEGLLLDNKPIKVNFNQDLTNFPTFDEFECEYRTNRHFFDKYQVCLKQPEGGSSFGDRLPRTLGGFVLTSFAASVDFDGQTVPGNVLSVEGFGNIYFGEVLMKEDNRRVTMVRLAMGCAAQAQVALGEVDHNGGY